MKKVGIIMFICLLAGALFASTYTGSGERTVVGFITGNNGQYEVFHRAPKDTSLYFVDSASSTNDTGFQKRDGYYMGPDGSSVKGDSNVLSEIQRRYNNGKYK